MPVRMSLILADSSCENGGGGEFEVSIGSGGSVCCASVDSRIGGMVVFGSGYGVFSGRGVGVLEEDRVRRAVVLALEEIGMMKRREERRFGCVGGEW